MHLSTIIYGVHVNKEYQIFGRLAIKSCRNAPTRLIVSVCPHITTWEPLNRFSWNFILGRFTKVCWNIPVLVNNNNGHFTWRPTLVSGRISSVTRTQLAKYIYQGDKHLECPDEGGNKHLWNVGKLLPGYTAQQPKRQSSAYFILLAYFP
jgi:hypothetical protein